MIDKTVTARFVRSDGAQLAADGTAWLLTQINGADAPAYELFTEDLAVGNGGMLTGKRVKVRDLQLDAAALSVQENPQRRATVVTFFNPGYTYRVYLTYMGRTRWLQAELAAFKAPNGRVCVPQTFSVYFLATDPFWCSVDDFGQDIAAITPRWGFPHMDHPVYGMLADLSNFSRSVSFLYEGDVPAWPVVTITAEGRVDNPKIVNGSAYVRLLDGLQAGDTVVISTKPPRITKNGANILNKVDRTSNFTGLAMQPGANVFRYEAEYGDNNLHVVIRYNKQYLGV